MKKFWTYIKNEKFALGCTERAVYLYDAVGKELAQFKDISHCGKAAFSPDGDTFVVKSTGAYFAVYSAEKAALIKRADKACPRRGGSPKGAGGRKGSLRRRRQYREYAEYRDTRRGNSRGRNKYS